MRVFISGPMRGHPDFNHPAFHEAAARLRAAGHEVFTAAERNEAIGCPVNADGDPAKAGLTRRQFLAMDVNMITTWAEAVATLDGWEQSSGAQAEVWLARAIDIPVYAVADLLDGGADRFHAELRQRQEASQ
jgi:hypothetical protein